MANLNLSDPKSKILYSDRYSDDSYEYRHVTLPPEISKILNQYHLLSETEWRNLGVQQSPGWINYMIHKPEPHILLFRRPISHPIPSDFGRHDINNRAGREHDEVEIDFQ